MEGGGGVVTEVGMRRRSEDLLVEFCWFCVINFSTGWFIKDESFQDMLWIAFCELINIDLFDTKFLCKHGLK